MEILDKIEVEDFGNMFEQMRYAMEEHRGIVTAHLPSVLIICEPTSKDLLELGNNTSIGTHMVYEDGRIKNRIYTFYNTRQLTVSFATILHELGHEYMEHSGAYDGFDEELKCEIEAWDWAHAHWGQVPVRRKWPSIYENLCLDSYTSTSDPFVSDHFTDINCEAFIYAIQTQNYQGIGKYFI